ncbi:methyl-accepting chemotaxis protein [Opitutus terrae]|uniref:Methyl-accepting chemotaxis sensory transducer n=1 Tax=Opitutus terrae (strain DSM 11246 / JCM 15787 / PB90-1) TaxID=452637 RepID=B1ZWA3_OPITP|nr:methyl-accepting chemotaxis protein [Opitutus terrae]ACB76855.1 methyl-accepting chemotaxis sensory transducer [Opitutus terrae PB90-1]
MNLSLARKLQLLVAIPLAGALIFSGIEWVRALAAVRQLKRVAASVELTADLAAVRAGLLAEQRESWDLYTDANRLITYRRNAELTADAVRRVAARLNQGSALDQDVRDAVRALLTACDGLREARDYFSTRGPEARRIDPQALALRARYGEVIEQLLFLVFRLNQETDAASLRGRLDGLVWFGRLALAAESERTWYQRGFAEEQLTVASLIRVQNVTAQRRYFASNAVLMAPAELLEYWNGLLAHPVYAGTDALATDAFNYSAPEPVPFKRALGAEWTRLTQERTQLLDTVEPHLFIELHGFLGTAQQAALRHLAQLSGAIALLVAVAVAIAAWFIRRIKRELRTAVTGLDTSTATIAHAVNASSEAAQRLAAGALKEAAGVEETGSALVTLTSTNQQNVTLADQTVEHMNETGALVRNSQSTMQTLSTAMQKISDSSKATTRIVKTINEIAFQTNILALNASIEAASAGEAGTGFAVVAEEVRNLAKRSSEATAETARLVDEVHAAIASGNRLTAEVEAALRDVEANSAQAGELMQSIRAASQQMLQNMQHINTGNRSREAISQQSAQVADHNAATAAAITRETEQLQATIARLEHMLLGLHDAAAAAAI